MSTFGESHGVAIGCVVDGVPAGLSIDEAFIQQQLDRRRPGGNAYGTKRNEPDRVEFLSGVFEGVSTGAPIAMVIYNRSAKSKDYENIRTLFRPGHGDFSWWAKYGIRDHRGGGRTSARESAARVAAGAIAQLMLRTLGIRVQAGLSAVGENRANRCDFDHVSNSAIFALDKEAEAAMIEAIEQARKSHDSIGAVVSARVSGMVPGLGEPLYDKLDGALAGALMGINAAKAVEIGAGVEAATLKGSENNDPMSPPQDFTQNSAGGVLAGVSTGADLTLRVHFKPTPSIFKPQQTVDIHGQSVECAIEGRHDPCVGVRAVPVVEAMIALVLADMALLNLGVRMDHLTAIYKESRCNDS
jgi:chorismate synthase